MNQSDFYSIIKEQIGYPPMRPLVDKLYHDGVSLKQIERWRSEWWRGALFGIINPVPDYTPESFDCDEITGDFIAFCRRKNAYARKALPMCQCVLDGSPEGHVVVLFVAENGTLRLYDPQDGTTPKLTDVKILYLGGM